MKGVVSANLPVEVVHHREPPFLTGHGDLAGPAGADVQPPRARMLIGEEIKLVRDIQPIPDARDVEVTEADVTVIAAAIRSHLPIPEVARIVGVQQQLAIADITEEWGGRHGWDEPSRDFLTRKRRLLLKGRQGVLEIV